MVRERGMRDVLVDWLRGLVAAVEGVAGAGGADEGLPCGNQQRRNVRRSQGKMRCPTCTVCMKKPSLPSRQQDDIHAAYNVMVEVGTMWA